MNYKSIKKSLVLVMSLVLVASSFGTSFAATTNFNDLAKAEWASPTIQKWTSYDLVAGYKDGTFRPNANITRAEFAVIAYNAFNLESNSAIDFDDVNANDWYYTQVGAMAKLGYIKGYTDGTFKPNTPITRAEAASIIANIQNLTSNEEGSKIFLDYDAIPTWARGHVGASAMAKFITGYFDATYRANNTITRAETVAMLNNAIYGANNFANSWCVVEEGIYGGTAEKPVTVKGNVYIKSSNVEIKNVIIEGNLIFGKEVEEGNATIDNVVVKGSTKVFGGGMNSIFIKNSNITKLIVIKENNKIRIVAQGSTTIASTMASSGVKLQEIDLTTGKGFTKVNIDSLAGLNVEFIGSFDEITVDSENVNVLIPAGTVVTSLVLDKAVDVTGSGTVTTAVVSVPGITFEKAPNFIDVDSAVAIKVEIAGKEQSFNSGVTTASGVIPAPAPAPAPSPGGGTVTPTPTPTPVVKTYGFYVVKDGTTQLVAEKPLDVTTNVSINMIGSIFDQNVTGYPALATKYEAFFKELLMKKPTGEAYTFGYSLASRIKNYDGDLIIFDQLGTQVDAVLADPNGDDTDPAVFTAFANEMATASYFFLVSDLTLLYRNDTQSLRNAGLIIRTWDTDFMYAGGANNLVEQLQMDYQGMTIAQAATYPSIFSLEIDGSVVKFVIDEIVQ